MLGPAAGAAPARGGQGCAPSNDAAGGGVALIFLGEEASTESLNPLSMVTRWGEERGAQENPKSREREKCAWSSACRQGRTASVCRRPGAAAMGRRGQEPG